MNILKKFQSKKEVEVLRTPLLLGSLSFVFLLFGLPIYSKNLGASALEIGGLYSIFTATTMLVRPVVGWMLDRYSRKRLFVISLLSYAVAMLAFAFTETISGLYLARFIEGIAAAFLWISIRTIAADLSSPEDRGRAMGRLQEIYMRAGLLGIAIGFLLIRFLPDLVAWKAVFSIYALAAALGAWKAWCSVPETRPELSEAQPSNHSSVIPRKLLFLMLFVFTTGIAEALVSPIYLIFLQDQFNADIRLLALAFFPGGIVISIFPSIFGKLSDRLGRAFMMASGSALTGLLYLFIPNLPNIIWLIVLYTLSSIGWTMANPAETAMVSDLSSGDTRGRTYGMYALVGRLGASIGPLLGGWLYDSLGHAVPFYITGIILLLSAILAIILLRESPVIQPS